MRKNQSVLICPLDWGIGHATRVVPIIDELIHNEFKVIIAASGNALIFLKREFPRLTFLHFPNYQVKYSKSGSQVFKMIKLFPKIIYCSIKEHFKLRKFISAYNIDIVISDNRFGLWNKSTFNIFITHQVNLSFPRKLKFLSNIYFSALRRIIEKYNECWIPDFKGERNLAGLLSHTKKELSKAFYIGPLSRFAKLELDLNITKEFDVLFILSGPEPQRTIFENIILSQVKLTKFNIAIVRGTDNKLEIKTSFPVYNIANTETLKKLIDKSDLVICRSGYSSIMDLVTLGKRAVLVPTPGQTEQEYLAKYLMKKGLFFSMEQKSFCLKTAYKAAFDYPPMETFQIHNKILKERVASFKNR